ncbi:sensor histidine kinase [Streptomyces pseudovenezuelae]|uniref:sensor histidine kinase n=1 Tax=Streptomyces pseudovenezuelae TaxID=67350 RepID=UPI0024759495|nr:histidine kinase [Streptomyces pseudovenezuelae]
MDWKLLLNPAAGRLLKISSLIAFILTWAADLALLSRSPDPYGSPTTWLPVFVTGPLVGLLALGRPRSAGLVKRVVGAVTISVAMTVWTMFEPSDLGWWGALETAGLLVLVVHTTGYAWRPGLATAYTLAVIAVILAVPLRSGSRGAFAAGGYVLTIAVAICVVIGCAVRSLEVRRERAVHDVRQAERLALARDLHDLIAHHMTGIIVQANAALTIKATAPDKVEPILREIARSGTETLESMRRLVRVLREDNHTALRPGDLLTELADLVSAHSTASGDATPAQLEVTAAARTARLSPEVELSVQRLVQEALTNVRRHASGARTTVHLDVDRAWLEVTVTNTAPRHKAAVPAGGRGGFGLLGLRERVEALDGTLGTGALPHGGWQVQAAFPLAVPADTTLQADRPGR